MQCELGPRNPGSYGHSAAIDLITNFLISHADTVFHQKFTQFISRDNISFNLTNIIASFNENMGNGLLLGTHWDTRPRAEYDPDISKRDKPILGANDGGSGTAVLMHLAEILSKRRPNRTIHLVFFDGEDYGYPGSLEYYCMGSEYFAKNLPIPKPEEAIIIDMIGDAELSIPVERTSFQNHPELVMSIWKIAEKYRLPQFEYKIENEIYDDHVPLIKFANIPSILVIDFEYPNKFTNYWHTSMDTPDKCSPESLKAVGQVILKYIYS